jgi:glycosyltransferase involved in cell wall biosynthesis
MIKLSIVTINWNNGAGLKKTIDSVIAQSFKEIEYIIVDGASTDNSPNIIEEYRAQVDIAISEPDNGIYNAMNKGLAKANGEYIMFLNSGDIFYSTDVLEKLFNEITDEYYFYGNIVVVDQSQKKIYLPSVERIFFAERYQHNLPMQPAFFAKRHLVKEFGGFDEQYKIIADVALIAKICNLNLKYKYINIPVTLFDYHGISSQKENQQKIYKERQHFVKSSFPQYLDDFESLYKRNFFQRVLNKLKSLF